jgi:DNA-binding GntR family transcriptional regulator
MPEPTAEIESDKLISGPMPLYYQIANIIRNSIMEGNWQPDSQLPTENGLAQKYGVSRPTIRNAKNILAKEGFVRSIKGSGCYVNNQKAWKNPPPTVDNLNDIFHYGSKMSFKIHECGVISSTEEINHKLKTPDDRFVFQIKGVRWHQGRPISCVRYYLPYRFGSRIPLERLDENPFIPQLEKMAGIKVAEGVQNISLGQADNETAKHLGLQEGDPVLNVKSVYFDENQQPVEYLVTNYREELPYSIRVKRN